MDNRFSPTCDGIQVCVTMSSVTVRNFCDYSRQSAGFEYFQHHRGQTTRCACVRGTPQYFQVPSKKLPHRTPTPCDWFTWRLKKIAYENSSTCTVRTTFLFTNFDLKKRFLIRFPANFLERLLLQDWSARSSIETSRQRACKGCMYHRMYICHDRALQACMKSAEPNTLDSRARANNRNYPAQSGRPQPSWSECFEIGASCQTSTVHVHANGCLLALALLHGECSNSLCWNSTRVGSMILRW